MLVLVVGDAHIPVRAAGIPGPIRKLLVPKRFDQVVSVGNINDQETIELLLELSPTKAICAVPGTEDIPNTNSVTSRVVTAGNFRIGVVSGFEIVPVGDIDVLGTFARQLSVDIILWGGTHSQNIQSWAGHYYVNPGSITGAPANWSGDEEVEPASFALLDITGDECTVYMYSHRGESVAVTKTKLTKPSTKKSTDN